MTSVYHPGQACTTLALNTLWIVRPAGNTFTRYVLVDGVTLSPTPPSLVKPHLWCDRRKPPPF